MNLMYPTCANIRNEFRLQYHSRCNIQDKRVIREFLEIPFGQELSDLAIKKCDTDKFKTVSNFLQKGINTREKTIELLAWLIDFPRRPFANYWRQINGKSDVLSELSITVSGIVEDNKKVQLCETKQNLHVNKGQYVHEHIDEPVVDYWDEKDTDPVNTSNVISPKKSLNKELTLEFPSGVKLYVDSSNIDLIAQLVKL